MKGVDIFCTSDAATSICLSMATNSTSSPSSATLLGGGGGGRAIDRHNPIIGDSKRATKPTSKKTTNPPILPNQSTSTAILKKSWSCTNPGAFLSPPGSLLREKLPSNPVEKSPDEDVQMEDPVPSQQVVVLKVSLHCRGCERKLRKHLSKMEAMDLGASSSSQSAMRVNQGPLDSSLLFRQESHISKYVYNGDQGCNKPLTCRRADTLIWEWIEAASNGTKMYIELYGFGPASRIGRIFYDWSLITSLVERWRPETHTFHLPFDETSITRQDVEVLFGLKIDGEPITGYTGNEAGLIPFCQRLLGFTPNWSQIVKGRLKFSAIKQHIRQVPVRDGAPGEMEEQRARCLILWLLGGLYFADSTTNRVPLHLLKLYSSAHTKTDAIPVGMVIINRNQTRKRKT